MATKYGSRYGFGQVDNSGVLDLRAKLAQVSQRAMRNDIARYQAEVDNYEKAGTQSALDKYYKTISQGVTEDVPTPATPQNNVPTYGLPQSSNMSPRMIMAQRRRPLNNEEEYGALLDLSKELQKYGKHGQTWLNNEQKNWQLRRFAKGQPEQNQKLEFFDVMDDKGNPIVVDMGGIKYRKTQGHTKRGNEYVPVPNAFQFKKDDDTTYAPQRAGGSGGRGGGGYFQDKDYQSALKEKKKQSDLALELGTMIEGIDASLKNKSTFKFNDVEYTKNDRDAIVGKLNEMIVQAKKQEQAHQLTMDRVKARYGGYPVSADEKYKEVYGDENVDTVEQETPQSVPKPQQQFKQVGGYKIYSR